MKYNISRDEKKLDPKTASKVYALTAGPLVETIIELLPRSGPGLAVKLLLQTPEKILDYNVNVKVATNEGKTTYEAQIEGITDVIQGTAVGGILSASLEVLILATLPVSTTVAAIGAAVGTGGYLAFNYDSQVKPALQKLGEWETHIVNKAINYFYASDTADITNPNDSKAFSLLTIQNDVNSNTKISYIPGTLRPAVKKEEVIQAILSFKEYLPSSQFFTYPRTLISLPDGQYTAMIGTNKAELLDSSTFTQPIEMYAGDGNDTTRGGLASDHHIPGKGDDVMEDAKGYNSFYIGLDEGKDTIKANPEGEFHYNAVRLSGMAKPVTSKEVNAPMWLLEDYKVTWKVFG